MNKIYNNSIQRTTDDKYFSCELNKFVNKNCKKVMTAINIDCAIHKISKKYIKIIEFKHKIEGHGKKQNILLETMAKDLVNITTNSDTKYYFYYVFADFNDNGDLIGDARIEDIVTSKVIILNKNELIKWLEDEDETDLMENI